MSDKTALGDRMKHFESASTDRRLMPLLPVCVRIDGRSFSRFTRGLDRPYDTRMSALMIDVTKYLVEESNAVIGYTQSDEINLVLYTDEFKSQLFFDGRIQKLESVLASLAAAVFNRHLPAVFPDRVDLLPAFDCRVWNVPSQEEAANCLLWRERDATKNSVAMAAQSVYSHKQLHGKNGTQMQEMLFQKGINWNNYPAFFKRGTFVRRVTVERPFTADERAALSAKHAAHTDPNLKVIRHRMVEVDMPPFGRVTNRVAVVFEGAEPVVATEEVDVVEDLEPEELALAEENVLLRTLLAQAWATHHRLDDDDSWVAKAKTLLDAGAA